MTTEQLKLRTKGMALRVIRLVSTLPYSRESDVIGRQLLRSATSVGANYRAACKARSRADFISKIGIVEEEADETLYWLELLSESKMVKADSIEDLIKEVRELVAIFTASGKTAKRGVGKKVDHS